MTDQETIKYWKDKSEWYKMLLEFEQKSNRETQKFCNKLLTEKEALMRENHSLKCELSDLKFELSFIK